MESGLEDISLAELLKLAMDDRQIDIHVALPAKVEAYHSSSQTVDVVPQLNRSVPDGNGGYVTEQLPKLIDVPVAFQRCQQFTMTFPLAAGDYGLLVFCERNIGAWRVTGNQGDPGDVSMHSLDGAVFIPGLFPDSKASGTADGTNMVLGSETDGNSRIEVKPSGGINLGAGATDAVVTALDLQTLYNAIANALVTPNDGGLALRNNITAALTAAGWTTGGSTHLGSTKIKAVR